MASKPVRKPRALSLVTTEGMAKAMATTKPPRTRPILLESTVFRNDMVLRRDEIAGEINMIDADEKRADEEYRDKVAAETERYQAFCRSEAEKRDAEARAQAHRREDLVRIHAGCIAALDASSPEAEEAAQ